MADNEYKVVGVGGMSVEVLWIRSKQCTCITQYVCKQAVQLYHLVVLVPRGTGVSITA